MELAKFHQALLRGRRVKSGNGEETAEEAQLMSLLQQLRGASPEAAPGIRETQQGGSRGHSKRKAGEGNGPGMAEPVIASKLLPAGFGRFTLVPLDNVQWRQKQTLPVDWKVTPRLIHSVYSGLLTGGQQVPPVM